jgi:putative lipoprotein (rSAM/lipoprotein system)
MMRLIYRLLATAIGILGLAGCSAKTADEYGQPYATYHLDGHVVTAKEKQPITGIKIRFEPLGDTLTDMNGAWRLIGDYGHWCFDACSLKVFDVDGDQNGGTFEDKTVPLTLTKTARGSGRWDEGTYEQHDIQIELDPDSTK